MNEELNKVEEYLDSYEKKIGLSGMIESDISRYLSLTQQAMQKMPPEECGEAAYLLTQEALFIQHEINKYQGQLNWANSKINKEIAGKVHEYGGRYTTTENRKILAIQDNSYAEDLQKIVDKADKIITRLSYLPNHLRNLATVLLDYRHTKIRSEKNETSRNT